MTRRLMGAALGLILLTASCSTHNSSAQQHVIEDTLAQPPAATGGGPSPLLTTISRDELAGRLTSSRCRRFRECGAIGPVGKYPDLLACERGERERALTTYASTNCSAVDNAAADRCLAAATSAVCGALLDVAYLPIVGACAATRVCPQ